MKNKHTQGKWRYDVKHNAICEGETYSHFCSTLIASINPNMGEETTANAKLIAAAPKLLETLTDLLAAYKKAMMLTTGKESNAITVIAEGVIKEATQ